MSTIAYRDGVMAADSTVTDRDCAVARCDKIFRVRGHLIGGVGSLGSVLRFVEWFKKGADEENRPRLSDDFDTLVVGPDGKVIWYASDLIPLEFRAPFHALGSGHAAALGALHMGATARQSIEAAAKVDNHTGLPVKILKLKAR